MFKWIFHILIFATIVVANIYQNKEKPLKRQRKLGLDEDVLILALIFNESLARVMYLSFFLMILVRSNFDHYTRVPDEWRQTNVSPVFKEGENYDAAKLLSIDRCRSPASAGKP